jgi:hypothetical protein
VTVFWDDDRLAGRWFDENVTKLGERQGEKGRVEWDAFILFGADARWGERGPDHISWGRTVYEERERLAQDLDAALNAGAAR